jgi:hypothetical protein
MRFYFLLELMSASQFVGFQTQHPNQQRTDEIIKLNLIIFSDLDRLD